MKISIIGSGAMGCIFTYLLKNYHSNINLYDTSQETVESIKKELKVVQNKKTNYIKVNISNSPEIIQNSDFIFIFVKSYDTESVAKIISEYGKNSTVVTLQNGIGNHENLLKHINEKNIILGTTTLGGYKTKLNNVIFGGNGEVVFGGIDSNKLNKLKNIFENSNIDSRISKDIKKDIWKKAIINAAINPLGALSSLTNGEILENSFLNNIQKAIVKESVSVANSNNIDLNYKDIINSIIEVCKKTSNNSCSMLQDIRFKRKTEIESINGQIVKFGKLKKIPTPLNQKIYRLIKELETKNS